MTLAARLRIAAYLLIAGLAITFGVLFKNAIERAQDAELQNKTLTAERDFAVNRANSLDATFTEKLRAESALRAARAEKSRQFETLKNEDPTVADWAAQPIPQRVRDLDRRGPTP